MKRNTHLFLIQPSDRNDWGLSEKLAACAINIDGRVITHTAKSKSINELFSDENIKVLIICINDYDDYKGAFCAVSSDFYNSHYIWVHFGNAPTISLQPNLLADIWNDPERPYHFYFKKIEALLEQDFQTYVGPLPYSKHAPLAYDKIIHHRNDGIAATVKTSQGKTMNIQVLAQLLDELEKDFIDGCKHFFDNKGEMLFGELLLSANVNFSSNTEYSLIRSSSHKVLPILNFINKSFGNNRLDIGENMYTPLLLILPDRSDSIQFEDILVWRNVENASKVIVFDTYERIAWPDMKLVPWLKVVAPRHPVIDATDCNAPFLKADITKSTVSMSNFIKDKIKLLRDQLFWNKIRDLSSNIIVEKEPDALSLLYYELVKLGANYLSNEHKVNQLLATQQANVLSKKEELNYDKYVLDTCEDMLQTCRFASLISNRKILLIDDRPELIQQMISDVTGMEVDCWNPSVKPTNENSELSVLLQDLANYTSLDADFRKKRIVLQSNNGASKELLVEMINSTYAYILVDVLFVDANGLSFSFGAQIIGGASRLLQDIHRLNINRCKSMPLLIALSRTDDTQEIHSCLRAGAVSYVLKSRITALPGLLGRLKCASVDTRIDRHHNFRALYRLPTEVISLLKSLHIDGRNFSQPRISPQPEKEDCLREVLADLLAAVPKADLHVHAASVMSKEFIFIGAFVTLLRNGDFSMIQRCARVLSNFFNGVECLIFPILSNNTESPKFSYQDDGIADFVARHKDQLVSRLKILHDEFEESPIGDTNYRKLRNILHHALGIRDYLDLQAAIKDIYKQNPLTYFSFALATAKNAEKALFDSSNIQESQSDVLRLLVLWLGIFKYKGPITVGQYDLRDYLSGLFSDATLNYDWGDIRKLFYSYEGQIVDAIDDYPTVNIELNPAILRPPSGCISDCPSFNESPLEYLIATGTRCSDLKSYLVGCELAGADFMRHPYLFRLYAQQTVHQFIEQGIMYAELRAAVSGYEDAKRGFTLDKVYQQFTLAFTDAQRFAQKVILQRNSLAKSEIPNSSQWLWLHKFSVDQLLNQGRNFGQLFPIKIGIILTGKRHKTTRELIREASAAIMMHAYAPDDWISLSEYSSSDFCTSRYLAFDLAGSEADNPPERHKIEFDQISRLHIPITVHAGENAPSGYIENAIMDLHARRIGHGLSVTDDPKLLRRIREDGVCIELCPVSNFQTCSFQQAKQNDSYMFRPYPLRELLNAGCNVCICTDNPTISYTNIIKEFFQASYAYSPDGLTLWDALGLIRAGFTNSFLSLPERKAILELVDQILSILFSDKKVITTLRCIYSLHAESRSET